MKVIAVVVMASLLAVVSEAQEVLRQWAGRAEYEMATNAFGEKDFGRMIDGLLVWESAYPNSEFAVERTQTLIYAYQQFGQTASRRIPLLYKIVALGPMLKKPSPEQTRVIRAAANALLEELSKPSIVAPADAKELATKALATE
ncbi:MAG: hypothetical protein ABIR70_22345 [Bryobacteraceae bacterium]